MHIHRSLYSFIAAGTLVVALMTPLAFADVSGTLLPSGVGNYNQWTPSTGSTHYTLVDESSCNGTTDYVRETTTGERDSFAISLGGIADGSKITQIDITPCASKNSGGGGNSTMKVFYRFSGVNSADSSGYSVSGTTPTTLATTNFAGLSHIKGTASTLEIGAVYSAGSKGLRLSRIATVITYTTLAAPSSLGASNSGTGILLGWTDNSGVEDGFKIERSMDGGAFSQIATVGVNVVAYQDSSVTANHTYAYQVRAYNGGGNSGYSNTATAKTTPAAPSALGAGNSGTGILLGWTDNSSVEDGFKIERSTDGGAFSQIGTVGVNVVAYLDSTVTANHSYTYQVRAYNAGGNSAFSNTATANTFIVPAAPTNLTATASEASLIVVQWTDNSDNELSFKIERKTASGAFSEIRSVGTNVTTSAFSASGGVIYTFRVRASNATGFSGYSNQAVGYTTPAAPAFLSASTSGTGILLNWTDTSTVEDGFKIERNEDGGAFSEVQIVGVNIVSWLDTTVTANHQYGYRVRAYNAAGNSAYSNQASSRTAPAAPTALSASNSGNNILLGWTDNASVEIGFKIERSDDGGAFVQRTTVLANVVAWTDIFVSPGHTYTYRVRAYNEAGNSAYSNEASANTFGQIPADPTNLTATASGSTKIALNWTDNSTNESQFKIERKTGSGGTFTQVRTVGANVITSTFSGSGGVLYTFRVRASNLAGNSGYTNEASFTLP